MKKIFIMLLVLMVVHFTHAQNTCNSTEESLEDLNSITKCTIKSSKKTKNKRAKTISVNVSAPKRYFKKRIIAKKKALGTSNSLNSLGAEEANLNSNSEFTKTLELRKSVAHLTNNLSAEEVKSAHKFMDVDDIPAFEKCKKASHEDSMDCFNKEMINHIQKHFSYPSEAIVKKTEGEIWVRFIIDQNGEVTNIKTLGPKNGELLKLEAKRVASKLPKFVPALKNGKTIAVKYGFPINFSLNQ